MIETIIISPAPNPNPAEAALVIIQPIPPVSMLSTASFMEEYISQTDFMIEIKFHVILTRKTDKKHSPVINASFFQNLPMITDAIARKQIKRSKTNPTEFPFQSVT